MVRDRQKLSAYRDKRAPGVTNEPFGDEALVRTSPEETRTESGAFVVHLHDATRRHYDVRLEVGGVLLSFAVPHGPSLDPDKKLLALKTEDHPIEYLDFEDVIPNGQYGAGPMIVWDRGSVTYLEGPAETELLRGKLYIELRGMKLRGRWALVKLAKGETGSEWLFFKKQDEAADPSRSIVDELPKSVLSGLTTSELEQKAAVGRTHLDRAFALHATKDDTLVDALLTRTSSPLMAAVAGKTGTTNAIYDAELDGVRVLAVRNGDIVALRTWTGASNERIEAFYPDVVCALRALPISEFAFDGELVAFDATGHPSLPLLAHRIARLANGDTHRAVTSTPVVLVVKDVLALGDLDTRSLELEDRRAIVSSLLPPVGYLRAATPLEGNEKRVLTTCASLGIATVIAKTKRSAYVEGAPSWRLLSTGLKPKSRTDIDHRVQERRTALRQVVVSNRDKVFWPSDPSRNLPAFTKGELVDYYASVADVLVPYLRDRPVILVRYPDGIEGKSFFQWNVPAGMPPWIRTLTLRDVDDSPGSAHEPSNKRPKRVFLVDDPSTLVYIANLGCIPVHVLASRAPHLSHADFLTIDFDVKQSRLRHAVTLARTLRVLLEEIGLFGFPKTSGQTGLHVLMPLGPSQSFETARALADLLGQLLVEQHPDIATTERLVTRRGAKVYVDTGQTGASRAIVAPYSVRAVPGATVSTPLSWDEVTADLDPRAFTIATVPGRVARRGDLLKGLLGSDPDVQTAVARLAEVVPRSQRK